jgi:hypothetical protein
MARNHYMPAIATVDAIRFEARLPKAPDDRTPLARDLVVIVQDRKEQAPSPLARLIAQWEEALHAEAVRAKRGDSGPDE